MQPISVPGGHTERTEDRIPVNLAARSRQKADPRARLTQKRLQGLSCCPPGQAHSGTYALQSTHVPHSSTHAAQFRPRRTPPPEPAA